VRQIKHLADDHGGRCARGVLSEAFLGTPWWLDLPHDGDEGPYLTLRLAIGLSEMPRPQECPCCGELYEQFSDSAPNISDGAGAQAVSPEDLAKPAVSDTINSLADTLVAKDETGSTDVNQKGDTNG
jgi:hypothetical protein